MVSNSFHIIHLLGNMYLRPLIYLIDNYSVSGEYRIYHLWRCTHQQNTDYSRLQTSLRGLLQLWGLLRADTRRWKIL